MGATIVDEVPFLDIPTPEPDERTRVFLDGPWDGYTEYDLVFENDSMYAVNYPLQAFSSTSFSVDKGYLYTDQEQHSNARPVERINDTLYIYTLVRNDPGYFKEAYVKTTFNDSILSVMKRYGVNYPELAGTWILEREYDYDHGNYYKLDFPHTLPDSIEMSRAQLIESLGQEKVYRLKTDGNNRDYSFSYQAPHLYFLPGKWYKGEDPRIHFRMKPRGD